MTDCMAGSNVPAQRRECPHASLSLHRYDLLMMHVGRGLRCVGHAWYSDLQSRLLFSLKPLDDRSEELWPWVVLRAKR